MKYLFDIVDVHNVIAFIKETHIYCRLQSCNQIVSCLYISSAAMILPTVSYYSALFTTAHCLLQHIVNFALSCISLQSISGTECASVLLTHWLQVGIHG